jgi:hypothetical protein
MKDKWLVPIFTLLCSSPAMAEPISAWVSKTEEGIETRLLITTDDEAEETDDTSATALWFVQSAETDFGAISITVNGKDIIANAEVNFEITDSDFVYQFVADKESWIDGDAMNVRNASNYCALLDEIREGNELSVTVGKGETYVFSLSGSKRNLIGFAPGCD